MKRFCAHRTSLKLFLYDPSITPIRSVRDALCSDTFPEMTDLSIDIEEELRAKNLWHFLLPDESKNDEIVLEIYENERWHPILNSWGSIVGVHLTDVLDRCPLTDETGNKVISGPLDNVNPLSGFKWSGDWTVRVDHETTDGSGYQYATGWGLMNNIFIPSNVSSKLMYVRRRRLTRKMVVDLAPPSKATPYELDIKIVRGTLLHGVAVSHTHVEVFLADKYLDRTISSEPEWNKKITHKLMRIDPSLTLTFAVYTKKTLNLGTGSDYVLRGTTQVILKEFLDNFSIHTKQEELVLISGMGERSGTLTLKLDLLETKMFSIVPSQSTALIELRKLIEDSLSSDLSCDITLMDNERSDLLGVFVNNIIEGRNVLTEADLIDMVWEARFLKEFGNDDGGGGGGGGGGVDGDLPAYPGGRPRYAKLIALPCSTEGAGLYNAGKNAAAQRLQASIMHEVDLQVRNERLALSSPTCSSVYANRLVGDRTFDFAYQAFDSKSGTQECFDVSISVRNNAADAFSQQQGQQQQRPPHNALLQPASTLHNLRWSSYHEYLLAVRELTKLQQLALRSVDVTSSSSSSSSASAVSAALLPARYVARVAYGGTRGTRWQAASFTIDPQAEYLVIRGTSMEDEPFEILLSFEDVDGIIVKNTYHMTSRYLLEVEVKSASSFHLQHVAQQFSVHIDSIDGKQHYQLVDGGSTAPSAHYSSATTTTSKYPPGSKRAVRLGALAGKGESGRSVGKNDRGTSTTVTFEDASFKVQLPTSEVDFSSTDANNSINHNNDSSNAPAEYLQLSFVSHAMKKEKVAAVHSRLPVPLRRNLGKLKTEAVPCQLYLKNTLQHMEYSFSLRYAMLARDAVSRDEDAVCPFYVVYFADGQGRVLSLDGTGFSSSSSSDAGGGPAGNSQQGSTAATGIGSSSGGAGAAAASAAASASAAPKRSSVLNALRGTGNAAVNVLTLGNASLISSRNTSDVAFQSGVMQNTLNPSWEEVAVLSSRKYGAALLQAKFLLVEIWHKNKVGADQCLGEVFIPVTSAVVEEEESGGGKYSNGSGMLKYPIQVSRHMKPAVASKLAKMSTLGAINVHLTRRDVSPHPNASPEEKGEHDLIQLQLVLRLKPITALDFTWPARLFFADQADDCHEDLFHIAPRHNGLHICTTTIASAPSDRVRMLVECREFTGATRGKLPADGVVQLVVPYHHMKLGDCVLLTTDAILCKVKFTRVVISSKDRTEVERPVTLELLVGPCPASDLYSVLYQRISLLGFRGSVKHLTEVMTPELLEIDAVARGLQEDILSTTQRIEGLSEQTDVTSLLESLISSFASTNTMLRSTNSSTNSSSLEDDPDRARVVRTSMRLLKQMGEERTANAQIFSDATNRTSVTYFAAGLPLRVLTVHKALLRVFFWFLMDIARLVAEAEEEARQSSGGSALDFYYGSGSRNSLGEGTFSIDLTTGGIAVLTHKALKTLLYGDPSFVQNQADSDDDSDAELPGEEEDEQEDLEVDAESLVTRVKSIMTRLDDHVRALFFKGYRLGISSDQLEALATKLVYEQYLVIVSYLADVLLGNDDEEEGEGNDGGSSGRKKGKSDASGPTMTVAQILLDSTTAATTGAAVAGVDAAGKLFTAFKAQLANVGGGGGGGNAAVTATTDLTAADAGLDTTGNASVGKPLKLNPQRKQELISYVISKDNLFEKFLSASLYSFDFKFKVPPHLSMCLDFDVLIQKFAANLQDNISMWNSKALKSLMSPRMKDAAVYSGGDLTTAAAAAAAGTGKEEDLIPWEITTLHDQAAGRDVYISHIPESMQIQLNVQIGVRTIRFSALGDTLSLQSIKRVYEINLKVAKAIANAYSALALEYDTFLTSTVVAFSKKGAGEKKGKISSFFSNVASVLDGSGLPDSLKHGDSAGKRGGSNKNNDNSTEDSDDLLCFLLAVANDCARIIDHHIPQSMSSFAEEFRAADSAVEEEAAAITGSNSSGSGSGNMGPGGGLGMTALEELNGYFFSPTQATKSVSRNAINCLTNQVLFVGDLKAYFLSGFSEYLNGKQGSYFQRRQSNNKIALNGGRGGGGDNEEEAEDEVVSPVATVGATLNDLFEYTAMHLGPDDQNRVIRNCLQKLIMRYLLMLRDFITTRVDSNGGIGSSLDNLQLHDKINQFGRSVFTGAAFGFTGTSAGRPRPESDAVSAGSEFFSEEQMDLVRTDLKNIMSYYLDNPAPDVAELVSFFVMTVNEVLVGAVCDPNEIDRKLQGRFQIQPPSFQSDTAAYHRALEDYIGMMSTFTHELDQRKIDQNSHNSVTIQFSDFACVNLKDYRYCVVRINVADVTIQSAILPTDMLGKSTIKWKDAIVFQHIKEYLNKSVVVELVEVRPLGVRREVILARCQFALSQLSTYITPQPAPAKGVILTGKAAAASAHTGWYQMEELPVNFYSSRGVQYTIKNAVNAIAKRGSGVDSGLGSSSPPGGGGGAAAGAAGAAVEGKNASSPLKVAVPKSLLSIAKSTVSDSGAANGSQNKRNSTQQPTSGVLTTAEPQEHVLAAQFKMCVRILEENDS